MTPLLEIPSGKAVLTLPQEHPNPRRRILLVDDDPLLLEVNAVALIRSGYYVDTAEDGAAAWNALHGVNVIYNLLVTDNKMPKMTGLELIKQMRSEEMTLPVILASGTIPTEELKRHPRLQLDATLPKPFTTAELLDAVNKVLRTAESAAGSSQLLFREYAMLDYKTPQTEKTASTPVRKQINPSHRILVVDDDNDTRQLSVDVLAGSGYEADGVKDGAARWEALQAGNHYDLVVTDNRMPNMTGIEMIAKLRSARITVPVIMATEHLPVHEFARRPWLNPDAVLERPFSNDDLLETVKKVLGAGGGNNPHMKMSL